MGGMKVPVTVVMVETSMYSETGVPQRFEGVQAVRSGRCAQWSNGVDSQYLEERKAGERERRR